MKTLVSEEKERSSRTGVHRPNLGTLLMIEKTVKEADIPPRKTELWKSLPRKVMYQTFEKAIDYLKASGKVMIDKEGRVVWVAPDTPELLRLMEQATRVD